MRAIIEIQELKTIEFKRCIVRNLSRIMDIKILDICLESKTLSIVYETPMALAKVKMELKRINAPIMNCRHQEIRKMKSTDGSRQEIN